MTNETTTSTTANYSTLWGLWVIGSNLFWIYYKIYDVMNTTLLTTTTTTTTKCAQGWILMETRARRLGNVGWISCGFCTRRVQTNVGWNISYVWFGNYVSLPVYGTDYSVKLMAIPVVVAAAVAAILLPPLHHTVVIQTPLTKRHWIRVRCVMKNDMVHNCYVVPVQIVSVVVYYPILSVTMKFVLSLEPKQWWDDTRMTVNGSNNNNNNTNKRNESIQQQISNIHSESYKYNFW